MIPAGGGGGREGADSISDYRTLICSNHESCNLDERMFLPPLEYPFFPGKFYGTRARANKMLRSVASQFHGLSEEATMFVIQTVGCFSFSGEQETERIEDRGQSQH